MGGGVLILGGGDSGDRRIHRGISGYTGFTRNLETSRSSTLKGPRTQITRF